MPFHARLNPASLARRHAAAARYAHRVVVQAVPRPICGGPGPSTAASLLARNYNTTRPNSAFSDLFRRQRQGTSPADALRQALSNGGGAVEPAYEAYVKSLSSPSSMPLSSGELAQLMEAVLPTRKSGSVRFLRRIYADLEPVHGVEAEGAHHRAMVTALAGRDYLPDALRIAKAHKDDMGVREWVAIVTRAAAKPAPEILDAVFKLAPLDEEIYAPLLSLLVTRNPTVDDIKATLRAIEERGVTPGPWCEVNLARVYIGVDLPQATAIVSRWTPGSVDDPRLRTAQWKVLVHAQVAADDREGVMRTMRDMDVEDDAGMLYLVKTALRQKDDAAGVLRAIDDVQSSVGRDLSPTAWSGVISLISEKTSLRTAWEVYCIARHRTPMVSVELANTFITQFTNMSPPLLDEALEVYNDLSRLPDIDQNGSSSAAIEEMYTKLLQACIATNPPRGDVVNSLGKDMEQRNIRVPSGVVAEVINVLMQAADNHQEAFTMYMALRNVSSRFSESQYNSIITNFIKLSFPDSSVAPPEFVTQMMQDMRSAGYQPGTRILTALLNSYAALGKKARRLRAASAGTQSFQVSALLSAIRDINSLINLDPVVTVDIPMLTALMDAFSCTGAFAEAIEVWDELVRLRPTIPSAKASELYSPAINVIIDTCGHAELLPRARRIWAWGLRHDLIRDERNWAAWIECLCRMGKFDEALTVVCDEMGSGSIPAATRDTTLIAAKFSWRDPKQIRHVVETLQQRFPQWADDYAAVTHTKQALVN